MKKNLIPVLLFPAVILLATGCQQSKTVDTAGEAGSSPATADASVSETSLPPGSAGPWSGTVVETISTAGYTYVHVDTGSEKIWAAAPNFTVKEGDKVTVPPGQPMPDYYSKSLDRTFDVVNFVAAVTVGDGGEAAATAPPAMPPAMPAGAHPAPSVETGSVSFDGIVKADGGVTVADLFSGKSELAGKEVALRGKVVKFSPMIMGKNWIHVQDGTDHEGNNDLTVTTMDSAAKGDTVLVKGTVTLDKDFGAGYRYDLILEDAQVSVE